MSKNLTVFALIATIYAGSSLFQAPAHAQPWANKPPLPRGLLGHVAAVSDRSGQDLLFVFGGGGGSQLFSRNDVFDPTAGASGAWNLTTYLPLPTPRAYATETVDQVGKVWMIGGSSGGNQAHNTVEVFDPGVAPGVWSTMSPLLTGRTEAAAATGPGGKIFVFGGAGAGGALLDSVEMFDPAAPPGTGWVSMAPMPERHRMLGAELGCDGLIYVMGRDELDPTQAINFAYDPSPSGNSWQIMSTPPLLPGDFALDGRGMTVGPDGRIYLINDGHYNTNSDPRVFSYDPQNDQWRIEPPSNVGYTALAAATLVGEVYALGGVVRFPPVDTRRVESLGPIAENSPCDPSCVQPPFGMVSWLPFDEEVGTVAADLVAGRNGTHVAQPLPVPGQVAGALSLPGASHVSVTHDPALSSGGGDFSVDLWLRDPGFGAVVGKYDGQLNSGWELYLDAPSVPDFDVRLVLNGSPHLFSSCLVPSDGQWHHLGVVVDRLTAEIRCYLDGFLRDTTPILDPNSVNNTAPLMVGKGVYSLAGFGGSVDELELFDRVLAAPEIQAIFGAGSEGKCKDSIHLPWDVPFCLHEAHKTVQMVLCNYSSAPRTYTLTFDELPAGSTVSGGNCDIIGPATFEDIISGTLMPPTPSVTISVPPGCSPPRPVRIYRPNFSSLRDVGCYQVTRVDTATGGTAIATGSVQNRYDICPVQWPYGFATQIARVGGNNPIDLGILNTTDSETVLDYVIFAMPAELGRDVLSLNDQEPGTTVEGSLTLAASGTAVIPLSVSYTSSDPFSFQDLILSTRVEGEDAFAPLASLTFRNPVPWDATSGVTLGDTVWEDVDGDGNQNGGEDGIAGVVVRLLDGGGNLVASATTDVFGTYYFTGHPAGSHVVEIDPGTLPGGAVQTYDLDGLFDGRTSVFLPGGAAHAGVDFGYRVEVDDHLFADGFESGDTSAWSSTSP